MDNNELAKNAREYIEHSLKSLNLEYSGCNKGRKFDYLISNKITKIKAATYRKMIQVNGNFEDKYAYVILIVFNDMHEPFKYCIMPKQYIDSKTFIDMQKNNGDNFKINVDCEELKDINHFTQELKEIFS